jgi:hypothetical protein
MKEESKKRMKWDVVYDKSKDIVEATVAGTVQVEQVAEMAAQIIKVARDADCHRCLIDYRLAKAGFSTLDAYGFMSGLAEMGAMRSDRVAIVYSQDAANHRFAETVSLNRGWTNIRYFSDIEDAMKWLSVGVV